MWQPDQPPPSKIRRISPGNAAQSGAGGGGAAGIGLTPKIVGVQNQSQSQSSPPVCPYCNSRFASGNNLRRHIVEVHKRNDAKLLRESSGSPAVFVDRPKECQACNMTFGTIAEWVDHKIQHARTVKPSSTFEWGCEICGKMFTRKERLLQHMITHLNDNFEDTSSNGGMNSNAGGVGGVDDNDSSQYENSRSSSMRDKIDNDDKTSTGGGGGGGYSCELCQVFFDSAQELRKHVTEHFVNGNNKDNNAGGPGSSQGQSGASSSDESAASTSDSNQKMAAQAQLAFAAISTEYKCRICDTVCKDQLEMMTCMASHQMPTNLKCGECQLYFSNAKQVIDHQALYHPNI